MNSKENGKKRTADHSGNQLGTFAGVFTPSILTILGVIMFMRGRVSWWAKPAFSTRS